jgi:GNAT superfamily N-acetyltransferase
VAATPLGSAAEVLVATGHDPFARSSLRRPVVRGWAGDGATAWLGVDPDDRTPYLSTLGEPAAVAALLAELLPELPPRQRVTLPRGTPRLLPAWVGLVSASDWDFRWLDAPPPRQPGEERVRPVDDEPAIKELLAEASPTASAQPGDAAVRRWVGVRDGGRLVACAADTSGATGVGHLSSIAVHPDARGQGLGRAVTAALTRRLFDEGNDLVTLGMYASNGFGRAVYDVLGYVDDHRFTSGPLLVRSRW